jgi:hypothetical protein
MQTVLRVGPKYLLGLALAATTGITVELRTKMPSVDNSSIQRQFRQGRLKSSCFYIGFFVQFAIETWKGYFLLE